MLLKIIECCSEGHERR